MESTFHLARLSHSQGLLSRAAELCRQGQADIAALLPGPEQALPALGSLDIALGCVLLEQDRLDEAGERLRHGLELMGGGMNPHYLMAAYTALFRLNEIQGRSEEALKYLDRLEAIWPDIAFCTRGLRVMHFLRTAPDDPRTLAEAASWSHSFSTASLDGAKQLGDALGDSDRASAKRRPLREWVLLGLRTPSISPVSPGPMPRLPSATCRRSCLTSPGSSIWPGPMDWRTG